MRPGGDIYFSVIVALDIAENLFLGRVPVKGIFKRVDYQAMKKASMDLMRLFNMDYDPFTLVKALSVAEKQILEILRAVSRDVKVLVMDEPTSSLTAHEVEDLFRLIRNLKDRGLAIIYISHRLEELDFISDRLTVLRDGKAVYSGVWGEISRTDIIRHMAGRELKEIFPPSCSIFFVD